MLAHYIKIAWRNILRKKLFAAINILGLAIGLSACIVIFLIIRHDLSFDKFHKNGERIYRIYSAFSGPYDGVNRGVVTAIASHIRENFTGVEQVAEFHNQYLDKIFLPQVDSEPLEFSNRENAILCDASYFSLFNSHTWLVGDPESALTGLNRVVLAESRARVYFGNDISLSDVIGKTITYGDSINVSVSGIVTDIGQNSDFDFTEFISLSTAKRFGINLNGWATTNSSSQTFIKLSENTIPADLNLQMQQLADNYMKARQGANFNINYRLQPLSELHFDTNLGIFNHGRSAVNKATLKILALLALLILVIASINFINLETAQASKRAKEIGVRKTLGGSRKSLILQFVTESVLLAFLATTVALPLSQFAMICFAEFLPKGLEFNLTKGNTLVYVGVMTITVGVLSGTYPAVIMSSFLPARALKSQVYTSKGKNSSARLRNALTVFQFAFSQVLIAGSIIMIWQMDYMMSTEMGFRKDEILIINTPFGEAETKKHRLINELSSMNEIASFSVHGSPPASSAWSSDIIKSYNEKGGEQLHEVYIKRGDEDYFSFYEIGFLAGRSFTANDSLRELVINETFARQMGFVRPGEALHKSVDWNAKNYTIVGVVSDFHHRSLHYEIDPVIMQYERDGGTIAVKLNNRDETEDVLAKIGAEWSGVYPKESFDYYFLDDSLHEFYEAEKDTAKLATTATLIAIVISCMGLFGLVSFTAMQRTKEIGIRKVLGASVQNIMLLLSADFLKLVLIAFAIAVPFAFWLSQKWLEDFAYRIDPGVGLFVVTGLVSVVVALLTVSQQAFRAASENPVKALRNE